MQPASCYILSYVGVTWNSVDVGFIIRNKYKFTKHIATSTGRFAALTNTLTKSCYSSCTSSVSRINVLPR